MSGVLTGKAAVVFGCANQRSLAWGVASSWYRAGAKLSIGVQSERFLPALEKLTLEWERPPHFFLCDVGNDASIDTAFEQIARAHGGRVDAVLHSVASATPSGMKNPLLQCTREDYLYAHSISAYSLIALSRGAKPLMPAGGSILALSYLGSQRVVPQYRVMGSAKAALETTSKYLAAELVGARTLRNIHSTRTFSRRPVL